MIIAGLRFCGTQLITCMTEMPFSAHGPTLCSFCFLLSLTRCQTCPSQSWQHLCMLFSSHFSFPTCVPCSIQSFSQELRSPYYIWNLRDASLSWIPPNMSGVSIILSYQGLILGEGRMEALILRLLSLNLFCSSLLYLSSPSCLQSGSCILVCFVLFVLPVEKKKEILVRHIDF